MITVDRTDCILSCQATSPVNGLEHRIWSDISKGSLFFPWSGSSPPLGVSALIVRLTTPLFVKQEQLPPRTRGQNTGVRSPEGRFLRSMADEAWDDIEQEREVIANIGQL